MAASSYDEVIKRALQSEGGYSNISADPGGPTNFGITIHDYRKYVNANATAADVRSMPVAVAKKIYREHYWNAVQGDELPAGVDYAVFDYGLNSGNSRAIKVLQRVVGVKLTGAVGQETLAAVAKKDPKAVINAICDERLRFLQGLKTWPVFGKGWARRVAEVRAYSLKLAGSQHPVAEPTLAPGKGVIPAPAVHKTVAAPAAGTGVVAVLTWHQWFLAHPTATVALAVAAGVVIVGILYLIRQNHQIAQDTPHPSVQTV